jgi:hypothetical protein
MLSHFRVIPFLLGLVIGIFIYFVYKPEKKLIQQYPKPGEENSKVFRDKNGTCYSYTSHEVNCDANESTLFDFPIQ